MHHLTHRSQEKTLKNNGVYLRYKYTSTNKYKEYLENVVGTRGFEPPTPTTPL